jgi:hypothetical protein
VEAEPHHGSASRSARTARRSNSAYRASAHLRQPEPADAAQGCSA